MKASLEIVLACASEIQQFQSISNGPERHHFDPVLLQIWQLDWVAELHRELATVSELC